MIMSNMAKGKNQNVFQGSWFQYNDGTMKTMNNDDVEKFSPSSSATSSIGQESTVSNGSSLSDVMDDASSSESTSFSLNSSQALYDLSEMMEQLPIKRGLSQFYKGKSESFTSLSRVASIEDLAKKATPYRRNLKASKSIGTSLHSYKSFTLPKAIITKKATRKMRFPVVSGYKGWPFIELFSQIADGKDICCGIFFFPILRNKVYKVGL
ncbi:oxidative stress 3 [Striga asiatica]|uniref:Oxidative stress 3 n=1 Tax=Striga asiatica TaxID=4170 RepID=A0A5A7Q637_STRAF|nr:oxidative stress 3 [Striga asiatica]